jgi:hypothetical protein
MISFSEVLKWAIDYVVENGFDNIEMLNYTLERLRKAAEASYVSDAELQRQIKNSLEQSFKRALSKKRLETFNPGVKRYTVERLMPSLRVELDRRIRANAELIKLNRKQAIDKTLQRFSGWMTSIPKGGSNAINKNEVKSDILKVSRQLRFETRRREIDQGHKLMAAIDATIAQGTDDRNGAIAAIWRSHWRQKGYDYREEHKERDGHIYTIRNNWAIERGLMKKGEAGYLDEITQPAEEPFCRCNAVYLYNLRDLPDSMLTVKGRALQNETKIK